MSPRNPTIAILTDPADGFRRRRYLVHLMIPRWESMGFRVAVVTGPDDYVPADLALLHVSLSVVPDAWRQLADRYPRVLNGRALDNRQRAFSRLLVVREGPDPGPVIVKTDWNCGGWREFRGTVQESPLGPLLHLLGREEEACLWLARLEARRSWRHKRLLPYGEYPVYASRALVPSGVWDNPNLVVERFVAERDGPRYYCRHWLFFGDREVSRRTSSPDPVIKFDAALEPLSDPVPEELRAIRRQLGYDYAKFDYGIVDGEVVLYDVNRTPGAAEDPARHAETIAVLSEGIRAE